MKLDVQILRVGRILDVDKGGGESWKLDNFHGRHMCIIPKYYNADFHSDGVLDTADVKEVFSFQKKTKAFGKDIFSQPAEITGSMYFENIFRIMCFFGFSKIYTKI